MSERHCVMIDDPLPSSFLAALDKHVDIITWRDDPSTPLKHVTGVLTYGHPRVDTSVMEQLPRLRVISNHGVGVDHIDVGEATRRGIAVGNTPDVLNGAVADMTFALLLAASRRLVESARYAAACETTEFDQSFLLGQEVHGRQLGIVGLGRIGRAVARRAQGFEMPIVYYGRQRNLEAERDVRARYVTFDTLLGTSDFVVLTVPLTNETHGLVGARELALMPSHSILINVSRGPVVDTDALVAALDQGQLWGAGLDVTDPEPLPRDHRLLKNPKVIVTSHIGSASLQTRQSMADLTIANLLAGLEGHALHAQVTPT